jgi:hypothetical protein
MRPAGTMRPNFMPMRLLFALKTYSIKSKPELL